MFDIWTSMKTEVTNAETVQLPGGTPAKGHKEQMRANKRMINRAVRELDRERMGLQRNEQKLITDIKQAAKKNQMGPVKIMAKDLVRTRRYESKFLEMKSHLQGVSLRMQTVKSTEAMARSMKGCTQAMARMNKQLNLPQLQKIMQEFQDETEKMGLTEESGDEEEEEAIVGQVLEEIGVDMNEVLANAPGSALPAGQKTSVGASKQSKQQAVAEGAAATGRPTGGQDNKKNNGGNDDGGGYGGSGRLDDLFKFDFNTRLWSQVHTKGETPTGRENNGAVVIKNNMYLFGGYSGYNWLNDFHCFNFDTSTWAPVEVKAGSPPSTRFGYVSSVHGSVFFVFGGYDGQTWLNDMHEFDVDEGTWSQTHVQGYIPTGRSCPSWAYHEGSVYLFGGYDGKVVSGGNEDLRTAAVAEILPCQCGAWGLSLYLFGGYSGQERLNDLHEFRFDLQTWFLVQTEDPPSGRSSSWLRFDPIHVPASTMEGDLRRLMTAPEFADVVFLVDGRRLLANKALLASRSEHFCAMFFSCGLREAARRCQSSKARVCGDESTSYAVQPPSQSDLLEVPITDVDYDTFNLLLEYIYTDKVHPDLNTGQALSLLITAGMFCIDRLRAICEDIVRHNITIQNCVEVLITAHHHNADGLKEICLEFLLSNEEACKHHSDGFKDLIGEPQLMYELLVRRKPSTATPNVVDSNGDPHRGKVIRLCFCPTLWVCRRWRRWIQCESITVVVALMATVYPYGNHI
ncbi:Leucine-zipper-like transcriptional regulator 1 [Perkinsus olseni]|uniref:Leucine-zipper-like transcriptional regulator 1 n=1 Tax=Perkinsus olseni TaxID=32597 RepID=A0A7J6PHS8_PEROL|nr:Leucine-zipper-like transcriptional regulator 1 [Perkinsus olseni]